MHRRYKIVAEVVAGGGVRLVLEQIAAKLAPGEYVYAHGSLVAARMLRLLFKLGYRAVLVDEHQTEARSLLPRNFEGSDGAVGVLLFVIGEHLGVVHFIDVVAGENKNIFGRIAVNEVDVLIYGVCGVLVPLGALYLLIGGENMHAAVLSVEIPRLTVADIVVELKRLILREHADGVYAGVDAVGKREINDTILSAKRNCRLGELLGQRVQTRALAACQDHCDHFFSHKISPLKISAECHV